MTSEDPDDQGGIERRDLLMGLGLGALGFTGTSAKAETVAAQDGLIDFIAFTPPGEDVEDDGITRKDDETPTFTGGLGEDSTGDLVFSLQLGIERSVSLGYQISIVDRFDKSVIPGVFAEGNSRAFSGIVKSDSAGFARKRERINMRGLGPGVAESPNRYWAVLTVVDYSGLSSKNDESNCKMDCGKIRFDVKPPELSVGVSTGGDDE